MEKTKTAVKIIVVIISLLMSVVASASTDTIKTECPIVKIEVERLPDLNIPRNSHSAFCLNGEMTVFGGHTTNFVPTPTAEYFKNGKWHLMEMAYPHDNALCVVLRSGKALLAGGHAEPMGVGQSYNVEEYDPATHTFRGFCIMDKKRTFASGVELDSGRVVVTGNWYADDGIEMFDGDRSFSPVKDVTVARSVPYLLRTSDGNVLILGNENLYGRPICNDRIDRLKGGPLRIPLLNQWQPIIFVAPFPNDLGFIGDEPKGDYSYLLAVQDWSDRDSVAWNNAGRELAFMLVRDTTFSMLPTTCSTPLTGVSPSDTIFWYSPLIADRKACRGYVHGNDLQGRSYILCVEYDKRPAPITLYYTDPLPDAGMPMMALTDDGNLMIVGGFNYNKTKGGKLDNDNFSPLASVYLLHVGSSAKTSSNSQFDWWWILLILAIMFVIMVFLRRKLRRKPEPKDSVPDDSPLSLDKGKEELMRRICDLLESKQLYLNSDFKLNDIADAMNTNRNLISNCINSQLGCSFSQLISTYRVEHAKKLIRHQPNIKISEVWMLSGFSTEGSFFRTFKAITGMTPNEFRQQKD